MGGGGGGDPGAEARRQEAERQARIKAATEEINRIFNNQVKKTKTVYTTNDGRQLSEAEYQALAATSNSGAKGGVFAPVFRMLQPKAQTIEYWEDGDPANSRQALYDQQRDAVFDINKLEVDRQFTEAERGNRFGLARAGLLGGSADIDSNADLSRRTNEGLMRSRGVADQAAADLQAADERTRSNLISMAQSGIDTGSAATLALQGLKANADSVASQRAGASIGGLFNDLSQAYLMNQVNQGRAAGNQGYGQWTGVSNPRTGDSGRVMG